MRANGIFFRSMHLRFGRLRQQQRANRCDPAWGRPAGRRIRVQAYDTPVRTVNADCNLHRFIKLQAGANTSELILSVENRVDGTCGFALINAPRQFILKPKSMNAWGSIRDERKGGPARSFGAAAGILAETAVFVDSRLARYATSKPILELTAPTTGGSQTARSLENTVPVQGSIVTEKLKLYTTKNARPSADCDVYTEMIIAPSADTSGYRKVTVEDKIAGTCELAVTPNLRTWPAVVFGRLDCGTVVMHGMGGVAGQPNQPLSVTDIREGTTRAANTDKAKVEITVGVSGSQYKLYTSPSGSGRIYTKHQTFFCNSRCGAITL